MAKRTERMEPTRATAAETGPVARRPGRGRSLAYLHGVKVERVRHIGPRQASKLARGGIETVADLLQHFPHRYVDRTLVVPITDVPIGEEVTVFAEVVRSYQPPRRGRRGPREVLKVTVQDADSHMRATGGVLSGRSRMEITFFNQPYRRSQLSPGTVAAFSGKVSVFRGRPQMTNPDVEVVTSGDEEFRGRVVPVHSAVGEMTPVRMRLAMRNALARARPIHDPLPSEVVGGLGHMERDRAFANIHFPDSMELADEARRRLVFDELFRIQLALAMTRHRLVAEEKGISQRLDCALVRDFLDGLPYELTGAQKRVLSEEIARDLESPRPMHRMLQGEVGSGKTVVALTTLLAAAGAGNQGAIMAPTEVLAEQLYMVLREMLSHGGLSPSVARPEIEGAHMASLFGSQSETVRVVLLTSSRAAANYLDSPGRARILEEVAGGTAQIVVGTHSLIQEGVSFRRLGVVVVDEQHRFGVSQRSTLKRKAEGFRPDLLIMTATPIPRTLSMTLYGDLALSYIDEMPPGRSPVRTRVVGKNPEGLEDAYGVIRREVGKGRQAFVICPLIDESEKMEVGSVHSWYAEIRDVFPEVSIDLMHGQLTSAQKEEVMARLRTGETDVLVSTTVIEVGIDVPNATVIVITDAQRFGLSQLHQLRGRVGRGSHPGHCVLVADPTTPASQRRMAAMARTTNGLKLAEEDLRIRGQGTVFGSRQSGMGDLRLADILRDRRALEQARTAADRIVSSDPDLAGHPELKEELRTILGDDVKWLFDS